MRSFHINVGKISTKVCKKIASVFLLLFLLPTVTFAATLSFSPASDTYELGEIFSVSINVNTAGEAINAISGAVTFPENLLEVVSISKQQSIVSLWVQEPYFSNLDGTINFEGIVLNPGFSGASGKVLNVTFKAKAEGVPVVTFRAGSVLANDGEGSEILVSKGTAQFSITATALAEQEQIVREADALLEENNNDLVPLISSETNLENSWSAKTSGVFNFTIPDNVTSLRLLLDEKPESIPTVVYTPPIVSKELTDLAEGVSYLHVQYKDEEGWGEILHYKIQIDTKAPDSLQIIEVAEGMFLFEASDNLSGIARYEIQIDGGEVIEQLNEKNKVYKVPTQSPGQHTLFVKALDAAGNFTIAIHKFEVVLKPAEEVKEPLQKEDVAIKSKFVSNGTVLIGVLSIVIPSLALILLLCALLYATWRSLGGLRRRIDKEVREANMIVQKAFLLLKTDLEVDIETLKKANEKRKLTREEAKILKRLRKNLDEAEKAISKEVKDIEEELQVK